MRSYRGAEIFKYLNIDIVDKIYLNTSESARHSQ